MDENDPLYELDKVIAWSQSYQWRRLLQNSKLRSALNFRYSIVIPRFIPLPNTAQSK